MSRRPLGCLLQGVAGSLLLVGLCSGLLSISVDESDPSRWWKRSWLIGIGLVLLTTGVLILRVGNRWAREGTLSPLDPGPTEPGGGASELLRRADAELVARIPGSLKAAIDLDLSWFLLMPSTAAMLYAAVAASSMVFFPDRTLATVWHVAGAAAAGLILIGIGGRFRLGKATGAADQAARMVSKGPFGRVPGAIPPAALAEAHRVLREMPDGDRDCRVSAALESGYGGVLVGAGVLCPRCGRAGSSGYAEFREVKGAFVVYKARVESGWFCGPCASVRFWPMTLATATLGGLGHESLLYMFAILPSNIAWYARSRRWRVPRDVPARLTLPGLAMDALAPHAPPLAALLSSKVPLHRTIRTGPWTRSATPLETVLYLVTLADMAQGSAKEGSP